MSAASHRFGTIEQASTTERGYGTEHRKARAAAAAEHDPSDPCARCGHELGPMGPQLHYDHDGERTGYIGFSHGGPCPTCGVRCNVVAGAREGRRRQGVEETPEPPRRDWYA